jgi:hypothetical protein
MPVLKDVHVMSCEYVRLHGKGELRLQMEFKI